MDWLTKLGQAIDYLEDHLDGDISYDAAAQIACCSNYSFQRLFSHLAGVTLAEYIRRRRMTQAAFELQSGTAKIGVIGAKYGYPAAASFHRAFQQVHGVAPSAVRRPGAALQAYPRLRLQLSVEGGESLPYRLVRREALRLVGRRHTLFPDPVANFTAVPQWWQAAQRNGELTALRELAGAGSQLYGVTRYRPDGRPDYYIAVASDSAPPSGWEVCEVPAATWVVLTAKGTFAEQIPAVLRRFLAEWLPFSGYTYAEIADIEVYPSGSQVGDNGRAEIWLAVRQAIEGEEENASYQRRPSGKRIS